MEIKKKTTFIDLAKLGLSCNKWKALQTCFPGDTVVKNPSANAGDAGDADSIPGL